MQTFNAWLAKNAFQILVLVATGAFAYATLEAEVRGKADKADITEIKAQLNRLEAGQQSIVMYLCSKTPTQLGCSR